MDATPSVSNPNQEVFTRDDEAYASEPRFPFEVR